jgi:formate hydrogenlyase subunit 6/NADH:ubiquinone oxidoreductase subunit I
MEMSDIVKRTVRPFRALKYLGRKPHTIRIPHEPHNDIEGDPLPTERYRGIHVNNWEECISCGLCAMVCPCDAIEMVEIKGEAKARPEVSYGRCCFCGFCEDVCPKKSIRLTSNHTMLDTDEKNFIFLPTPSLKDFEHEYMVDTKKLCLIKRKKGRNVIIQGDPYAKVE